LVELLRARAVLCVQGVGLTGRAGRGRAVEGLEGVDDAGVPALCVEAMDLDAAREVVADLDRHELPLGIAGEHRPHEWDAL